jgi:transcription elongation factor S-II
MDNLSSDSDTISLSNSLPKYRVKGQSYLAEYLPPNLAIDLEKNIYKFSEEYIISNNVNLNLVKNIYKTKLYDIYYNLNPNISPTLLVDILNKKIDIITIPYIQANQLNPTLWDPIIKKKDFIEYKKNNMATSDAYECKRCKKRRCKVFLLQTRSADEPMTIIVQCENCNCSFRIY